MEYGDAVKVVYEDVKIAEGILIKIEGNYGYIAFRDGQILAYPVDKIQKMEEK